MIDISDIENNKYKSVFRRVTIFEHMLGVVNIQRMVHTSKMR